MITLVCGPPCAGKSTYVEQHRLPTDTVVCHDLMAQAAGSPLDHDHTRTYRRRAEFHVHRVMTLILEREVTDAWVIRCLPGAQRRAALANQLRAEVVVLTEPLDVLLERAAERENPACTERAIRRWFARETAGVGEISTR